MAKNQLQKFDYEFDVVKEETDEQMLHNGKYSIGEDHMYMKVRYSEIPWTIFNNMKVLLTTIFFSG